MPDISPAAPARESLSVSEAADVFRKLKLSDRTGADDERRDPGPQTGERPADEPPVAPADAPPSAPDSDEDAGRRQSEPRRNKPHEEAEPAAEQRRRDAALEAERHLRDAALEGERRGLAQERAHYARQLQTLIPALQQQAQGRYGQIDWIKLSRENPAGYVQLRAQYESDQQRAAAAQAEQTRLAALAWDEEGRRRRAYLDDQGTKLAARLPEFADREKGGALRQELSAYLTGLGFSAEEVGAVSDHRAVVVAHKAMLYDRAQKAREDAQARNEPTAPVQKPGAGSPRANRAVDALEALGRLRRTGRLDDAAAAIRKLGIGA